MTDSDYEIELLREDLEPFRPNESTRDEGRAFRWLVLACATFFYILMVYHKEFENCKLLNCM